MSNDKPFKFGRQELQQDYVYDVIPRWKNPVPCPVCNSDQVAAIDLMSMNGWCGYCDDCGHLWKLDTIPT